MANGNGHALELAQLPGEVQTLVMTIINAALALAQLHTRNSSRDSNSLGGILIPQVRRGGCRR